jgi:hypothetical protein
VTREKAGVAISVDVARISKLLSLFPSNNKTAKNTTAKPRPKEVTKTFWFGKVSNRLK